MKTAYLITYVLLVVLSTTLNATTQIPDTLRPKNVLVLFAGEVPGPAYEVILASLKDKIIGETKTPVNFYVDFVGLRISEDEKRIEHYFNDFNEKYSTTKIDLFISIGPGLYPLIEKYCSTSLDSIPSIFLEFSTPLISGSFSILGKNKTAILIDLKLEEFLEAALHLFPDTKNVFVIAGVSRMDKKFLDLARTEFRGFEGKYNMVYLSGMLMGNLLNRLNEAEPNSIVFCPFYQRDSAGIIYNYKEIVRYLSLHSKTPVFQIFDAAFKGSVGGLLINTQEIGEKIGEVSLRIMKGEKPESIGIYQSNFSEHLYDWEQMEKWNIDDKEMPLGSIIINRRFTFLQTYYQYFIAGSVFVLLETTLLIYLVVLFNRQKKQAKVIKEKEDRYKSLVDFDRMTAVSELTASISHQLNQPLTAILSSSQAAIRFLKNDRYEKELFEEILSNIVEDVKRGSEIMISLRSMIKKESREKKRVSVNEITKIVYRLFDGQASLHDIIVDSEFDKGDPVILADSVLIEQVILNLLLNSAEALEGKNGGYKRILLKTEQNNGFVNISVSDNGPGIPDSVKSEIFKPFYTTKSKGLGIGLAICRSIIEDHNGILRFENGESGGVTFSFVLKTIK